MTKKYEFTGETLEHEGRVLKRIRAMRDLPDVPAGTVGGWIEDDANLSHEGNCWVGGEAKVFDEAKVYDGAMIRGTAQVYGRALVYGAASVAGDARVHGEALVYHNAVVQDKAEVHGAAHVLDRATIEGRAEVYGSAKVRANAVICGDARLSKHNLMITRRDGYAFSLCPTLDGPRIIAGCRYFTYAEAAEHWRKGSRSGTDLGRESLEIVKALRALAKIRGGYDES